MSILRMPRRPLALFALTSMVAGCGGGGGTTVPVAVTPTPVPTATATGTGSMSNSAAYTCSTSDSVSARAVGVVREQAAHRAVARASGAKVSTGLIAVTYSSAPSAAVRTLAVRHESAAGASFVREMTFPVTGRYERVLQVPPGTEAASIAALRGQAGVISATMTGSRRSTETVSQRYFPNDPYYNGFTEAQILAAGDTGSATYHAGPYEESESVPGQWGMHAVGLDYAQEYSQAGNGSGIFNAGALGSSSVKIAVIDTGEDSTHPELASKIAYQKCFLTGSGGQSTSNYSVDQVGHGTDVAGIAAGVGNNGVGFTSTGGLAEIYAYRVFPTPDDTCVPGDKMDAVCNSDIFDIASAIDDAVAEHVNVINLSLGGDDTCTNGVSDDATEQNAIDSALAANIVVVAASGNSGTSSVAAPACIANVIAVGASALSDGNATGTTSAPAGSSASPVEYAAEYSQYGSPAMAVDSASAWGILAPGGDPSDAEASASATSVDNLHWIENIWTTTPLDATFAGSCGADFASTSAADCRVLIAGTSQATPVVAGAAAAIIAANAAYQSPSKMKTLLCTTAHDIGDAHEGCGRLDLYRAMATAVGDANSPASQ